MDRGSRNELAPFAMKLDNSLVFVSVDIFDARALVEDKMSPVHAVQRRFSKFWFVNSVI